MGKVELFCIDCLEIDGKEVEAEYFAWFVDYGGAYTYLCSRHLAERINVPGENVIYQATNIKENRRLIEIRKKKP
jgi:hypothetical protein